VTPLLLVRWQTEAQLDLAAILAYLVERNQHDMIAPQCRQRLSRRYNAALPAMLAKSQDDILQ